MAVIWLVRHGEAAKAPGQSPDDLFSIARDPGLSARGLAQAENARDRLAAEDVRAVFASPMQRARETAEVLAAPHRLAVHADPRLAELEVKGPNYEAVLHGILDLTRRFEEDPSTFATERAAFEQAIGEIATNNERAIVVAHALSIRAYLAKRRGIPMREFLTIPMEHASITRIEL